MYKAFLILFIQLYYLSKARIIDPIDLLIPSDTDSSRCRTEFLCQQCEPSRIRCENLNLTSLSPLRDAYPDTTESIRFSGNLIKVVNIPIFAQPMSSLKILDLSNNQIEVLESSAFDNMPVLDELVLDINQLDLEEANLTWFDSISSTLTKLSLINAFKSTKMPQLIDIKLHSLLKSVANVNSLKLSNNSLSTFNVDSTVDFNNLTESDRNYEDVLCVLQNLEDLYLDRNKLTIVKFEVSCINQNEKFNLTSLHLESNQLANIDLELIRIFKRMKFKNDLFKVYLSGNPFRCDCSIYEFYKFLMSNESDAIIDNKSSLKCTNNDSIIYVYGKRIIEAQIDRLCGYQNTSTTGKFTYIFTTKTRTTTTTKNGTNINKEPLHSSHKLILFMFASLLVSCLIAFILKVID